MHFVLMLLFFSSFLFVYDDDESGNIGIPSWSFDYLKTPFLTLCNRLIYSLLSDFNQRGKEIQFFLSWFAPFFSFSLFRLVFFVVVFSVGFVSRDSIARSKASRFIANRMHMYGRLIEKTVSFRWMPNGWLNDVGDCFGSSWDGELLAWALFGCRSSSFLFPSFYVLLRTQIPFCSLSIWLRIESRFARLNVDLMTSQTLHRKPRLQLEERN